MRRDDPPSEDATRRALHAFLTASSHTQADRLREELILEHIDPMIKEVIARRMHVVVGRGGVKTHEQEAAEDIYCDTLSAVIGRLDAWRCAERRDDQEQAEIRSLRGYVVRCALNSCREWVRTNRANLTDYETTAVYLLRRQDGLAMWMNVDSLVGGYAAWRDAGRAAISQDRAADLLKDPPSTAIAGQRIRGQTGELSRFSPAERLGFLLDGVGGPVEMDLLCSAYTILMQETERTQVRMTSLTNTTGSGDEKEVELPDAGSETVGAEMQRDILRRVWTQIKLLPIEQRKALLLNLQDGNLRDFPKMQIAAFSEIAAALEKSPHELAAIWKRLPLEDAEIAADLNTGIQKVKNLRQAAIRTITWRVRPFGRGLLRLLWQQAILLIHPRPSAFMLYVRDAHQFSLLAMLPRESIATKESIAEALRVAQTTLDECWKDLPLSYRHIGAVINLPQRDVVLHYCEACRELVEPLRKVWCEF